MKHSAEDLSLSARSEEPPTGERTTVDPKGGADEPGVLNRAGKAKRRPVIPAWARSRREFGLAAKGVGRYAGHVSAYHAVRVPWYALRLTLQAPCGAARFVGGSLRWVADMEGEPLRQGAATREDVEEYLKLSRQRDRRVRWRTVVGVVALVGGMTTALALYVLAPTLMLAACGAVVTMALGRLGQPADSPVIHRAVEIPKATRLTIDIVLRALGSLGIPAVNQAQAKGGTGFSFTAPITRDGPGWLAEGDLPYGVTVTDVVDRREKLASGLRRPARVRVARGRSGRAHRPAPALGRRSGHVPDAAAQVAAPGSEAAGPVQVPSRSPPTSAGDGWPNR